MNSMSIVRYLYKVLFLIFFVGFFTYALQSTYNTVFLIYSDVTQIKLADDSCMDIYFHFIYWTVFFIIYGYVFFRFFNEMFVEAPKMNRVFEIVTASYFMLLFVLVPLYLEVILAMGKCS